MHKHNLKKINNKEEYIIWEKKREDKKEKEKSAKNLWKSTKPCKCSPSISY